MCACVTVRERPSKGAARNDYMAVAVSECVAVSEFVAVSECWLVCVGACVCLCERVHVVGNVACSRICCRNVQCGVFVVMRVCGVCMCGCVLY